MSQRVKMVCDSCGSQDVQRDAWAEWSVEEQEWVLSQCFDHAFCNDCAGECHIVDEAITNDD